MRKKKIVHLDCTLRDGGYYNNWNFSINLIENYLRVMSEIKVDYVEIGFRSNNRNEFKGPCAYTAEQFLNSLVIPKNLKIAVMVNASELLKYKKKFNREILKKFFVKKNKSKVDLIRIAAHFNEVIDLMPLVSKIKSLGYKVAINLMQISDKTSEEIEKFCKLANRNNIDVLYFADSTGSLDENITEKIVNDFKSSWDKDLGIHAHDNMDKAMENSMRALAKGVNWIDSTVLGMGRGPGNVKTENLIIEFEKKLKKN